MDILRPTTWLVSLGLHAALLLSFITFAAGASYDRGSGEDNFSTEQTITVEGLTQFGGNEEVVESIETPPVQEATPPKPLEEIKPELNDVIAATESAREEEVAKDVPKPVKEEKPVEVAVQEQAPTIATTQETLGSKQQGGDASARQLYFGEVTKALQRNKVDPRSRQAGTVMVRFTVGPDGSLISRAIEKSSGSKVLDDAAVAALDRAAPFPPMPQNVAQGPIEVSVPFQFVTR
jgi:periplasmic protein TonB